MALSKITTRALANDSVTADKVADNAITTDMVASGEIGVTDLADGAITNAKISATAAIAPSKIDMASVTALTMSGHLSGDTATFTGDIAINNGSPEFYFGTTGNHYNWMLAAQENLDQAFEISVGSQDTDYSNDTYSKVVTVKADGNMDLVTGGLKVGGTTVINSSQVGFLNEKTRIGTGATYPTDNAQLYIQRADNNPYIGFFSNDGSRNAYLQSNGGGAFYLNNAEGGGWAFNNSTSDVLSISNSGTLTTPTLITGAYGAGGSSGDGFRLNSTDLYGQINATDKVRIAVNGNSFLNGGNVGIGDTGPTSVLSIKKNSTRTIDFENMLKITHTSSGTTGVGFGSAIYFVGERNNGVNQAMGRLVFDAEVNSGTDISSGFSVQTATAGSTSEKLRVTHDGNVGIGVAPVTISFDRVLHLHGTSTSIIRFTGSTYGTGANDGPYIGMSYGGMEVYNPRNSYTRFHVNNEEILRLNPLSSAAGSAKFSGSVFLDEGVKLNGGGVISSNGTADTIVLSGSNAEHVGAGITLHGNAHSNASQIWMKNGSSTVMKVAGGKVGIGPEAMEYPLQVSGANVSSGGGLATFAVFDNDTAYNGTNPGGGITFRGKYNSSGNITNFATVQGIKENTTNNDYSTALRFTTRANGGTLTERLRIDSAGRVTMPNQPVAAFGSSVNNANTQRFGASNVYVNIGSHLDAGSNSGRFTCPVAGNYLCTFSGYSNHTAGYGYVSLRKNGLAQGDATHWNNGNVSHSGVTLNTVLNCAAGNYLEYHLHNANSYVQGARITFQLIS